MTSDRPGNLPFDTKLRQRYGSIPSCPSSHHAQSTRPELCNLARDQPASDLGNLSYDMTTAVADTVAQAEAHVAFAVAGLACLNGPASLQLGGLQPELKRQLGSLEHGVRSIGMLLEQHRQQQQQASRLQAFNAFDFVHSRFIHPEHQQQHQQRQHFLSGTNALHFQRDDRQSQKQQQQQQQQFLSGTTTFNVQRDDWQSQQQQQEQSGSVPLDRHLRYSCYQPAGPARFPAAPATKRDRAHEAGSLQLHEPKLANLSGDALASRGLAANSAVTKAMLASLPSAGNSSDQPATARGLRPHAVRQGSHCVHPHMPREGSALPEHAGITDRQPDAKDSTAHLSRLHQDRSTSGSTPGTPGLTDDCPNAQPQGLQQAHGAAAGSTKHHPAVRRVPSRRIYTMPQHQWHPSDLPHEVSPEERLPAPTLETSPSMPRSTVAHSLPQQKLTDRNARSSRPRLPQRDGATQIALQASSPDKPTMSQNEHQPCMERLRMTSIPSEASLATQSTSDTQPAGPDQVTSIGQPGVGASDCKLLCQEGQKRGLETLGPISTDHAEQGNSEEHHSKKPRLQLPVVASSGGGAPSAPELSRARQQLQALEQINLVCLGVNSATEVRIQMSFRHQA